MCPLCIPSSLGNHLEWRSWWLWKRKAVMLRKTFLLPGSDGDCLHLSPRPPPPPPPLSPSPSSAPSSSSFSSPSSSSIPDLGRAQLSHCFQATQLSVAPTVCEAKTHARALSQDHSSEPEGKTVPAHVLIPYIACNIVRHLRRHVTV